MTTTAEEVLKEALQLSEGERARVAAELLASLEPDVETRDGEAWIAEVERRAQAAIAGVPGLTWDEGAPRDWELGALPAELAARGRTDIPTVAAAVNQTRALERAPAVANRLRELTEDQLATS